MMIGRILARLSAARLHVLIEATPKRRRSWGTYTRREQTGAAMTAETQTAKGQTDESRCWCCGQPRSEDTLVHLGNHPEVGICISCVHFLRRRARDQQATVVRQTLRGAAESVRGQVMARGWHQQPVIGPALQWLNRHLPW
jgi:hypothetical protein